MPVAPTYPGVYIQEIPSGVHTITGVSTSLTAFIGRTARGPVNEPVTINSYADFERTFGGLWSESRLCYAVRDFFINGGSRAIIVRLCNGGHATDGTPTPATNATLDAVFTAPTPPTGKPAPVGASSVTLPLQAVSPGSWGKNLKAQIDNNILPNTAQQYVGQNLQDSDLFNVTVTDTQSGVQETFRNVSLKPGSRQIANILANQSQLVRMRTNGTQAAITDGDNLSLDDFVGEGFAANKQGLYALEKVDLFNLLCIPPLDKNNADVPTALLQEAAAYCEKRRAMLIIDPPKAWIDQATAIDAMDQSQLGVSSGNAMVYFPRLTQPNPLNGNQLEEFAPCGAVAGVIARTDAQRGVWKAPAGLEATIGSVTSLSVPLTDDENGELHPLGVNCLRTFPAVGQVVWGARTLKGDDRLASEWKYIPVRRLALYIEESLYRGTKWAVFEPNDEPLWSQLRLNIGAFMHDLFRQGAFQGQKPQDAYFVRCDSTTTTQNDIDRGIVNIVVGYAPLKPAEFVILSIQQIAGQIAV